MALSLITINVNGIAGAGGADPTFPCVVVNADTCKVTIPLTSNMDEQVGSTMPDTQPWFLNETAGNGAPYGVTGPGNPQTTWDGVSGALQGTVWTAILTTGSNEPAGGLAILTFAHVTPNTTSTTVAGQSYTSISESYPLHASDGSAAIVTAVVRPVPAKGHLILQRKNGSSWVSIGAFTYSTATKKWTIHFTWHFPKHTSVTFRVLATAAPGLLATIGGNFKIATAP
ncbi:MAG: hypothetical protein ACHQBP_03525 [Acidimicrobiales bacterium]